MCPVVFMWRRPLSATCKAEGGGSRGDKESSLFALDSICPRILSLFLLNIQIRINYGLNIFCHFAVAFYQSPNATTECLSQRPMRMPHRFPPKSNLLPSGNVSAPVLVVPLAAQTLESVSLSGSLVRILNQPT